MKEKFTKGPWKFNACDGSVTDCTKAENEIAIVSMGGWDELGVDFSNANLIACAPDMYEEIKRDIECLTRWIDNHGDAFPMTAAWKDMRASKIEPLKRVRGEYECK